MKAIKYHHFAITFSPKPIPDRRFDYDFQHEEYDGEGDNRCGNGLSVDDCKKQIDEYWDNWSSAMNEINYLKTC